MTPFSVKMIDNKEINITKIGSLKSTRIKQIAKDLKLKNIADKSGQMLREEIQHLAKTFLAGQVRQLSASVMLISGSSKI